MKTGSRFKLKTYMTPIAMAIGVSLFCTDSVMAQILVDGGTTHADAGETVNTGATDDTPAVKIVNKGQFIADGALTLSTDGQRSYGLSITGLQGSAELTAGTTTITTSGYSAHGIYASGPDTMINADDLQIHTTGEYAYGISISANTGNTTVKNGSITTTGTGGNGIYHNGPNNKPTGSIFADNMHIITQGKSSDGVMSHTGGGTVTFINGSIRTEGDNSNAAAFYESKGVIENASLETRGNNSTGVVGRSYTTTIKNTDISIYGDSSSGLSSEHNNTIINATDVNIKMFGNNVRGTYGYGTMAAVSAALGGTVNLQGNSIIETSGTNGTALLAYREQDKPYVYNSVINAGDGINLLVINTTGTDAYGAEACLLYTYSGSHCRLNLQEDILTLTDLTPIVSTGDFVRSSEKINIDKARITTSGENAYGLYIFNDGSSITGKALELVTSGKSAHAIVMRSGGEVTLTDSQLQTYGEQADDARIAYGLINDSTAKLSLINSHLVSDTANGINVEPGNSEILLDHSQLMGKQNALLMSSGNTTFSALNGSVIQGNLNSSGILNTILNNSWLVGDVISQLGETTEDALLLSAANNSVITGGMNNVSTVSLSDSQWNMTKSSDINGLINLQTGGLQLYNSIVNFVPNGENYKTLTTRFINGNGTFILNTELNDGGVNTRSDFVHVTEDASGDHNLIVNNTVGTGALTTGDGIQVVKIDGVASGSFTLANSVSAGAYQYLLYQGGETGDNNWYLRSFYDDPLATVPPDNGGVSPQPPKIIYRPEIAGYISTPYMNQQYGFDAVGTYRERVSGEVARNGSESWARSGGNIERMMPIALAIPVTAGLYSLVLIYIRLKLSKVRK